MLIKIIKGKKVTVVTKENLQIEGTINKIDKQSNLFMRDVNIKGDNIKSLTIKGNDICYIIY